LSEALRSGEILSRLRIGFRIDAMRGYGGNVLAIMFPAVRLEHVTAPLVAELIEKEKALLESGTPHFYALIVAEPKRGLASAVARVRYFIEPKFRRIRRALLRRRYEVEEDVYRPASPPPRSAA
jgi:hypothetical protein